MSDSKDKGPDTRTIVRDGLWDNNVVLGQMLGMCPVMAVTSSATNGLGMGLATMAVLVLSNTMIASIRNWVSDTVRIPVFIALIAGLVTLVDICLNAWLHELYKVLGIYIALIVVNCAVLGRAEAFASRNTVAASALDGIAMGLGFTLALVVMGGIREILGAGTLFANAHILLGAHFAFLEMRILPEAASTLFMILPPGGFLTLGLLIAARRRIQDALEARAAASAATSAVLAN
ncbi:electron transport complex subunit E [Uliginosibacterium sp. TH139]|uniref:electron transport complex subunit E n=1 Tax=Uliginosibacterium sp. TH139 TaxID=2067453 RepID=UPI000C7B5EB7|nr:electron transport complex subunit E [Uliginosibacterium sp. TH139]PLK47824.1 electron transport complex subunit RsxE [Uliginosibacterium sp. TH139]